jgi:hypothetical protein
MPSLLSILSSVQAASQHRLIRSVVQSHADHRIEQQDSLNQL